MHPLRRYIDIMNEAAQTDMRTPLERLFTTLAGWLQGEAMSHPVNDAGERFSIQPYYQAIEQLAKQVEPKRLHSLSGTMYRGIMLHGKPTGVPPPGRLVTARKRLQSWSPIYDIAESFATEYSGDYGIIFHADISANRDNLVLSIRDAFGLFQAKAAEFTDTLQDTLYVLENFAEQDEVLIRGTNVIVSKAEVLVPNKNGVFVALHSRRSRVI